MLTQTSIAGIRTLVLLALHEGDEPVSPRQIAGRLDISPSYLAKITGLLVKADILRSHRGVKGGVTLSRAPGEVTLLDIVEACQGKILGNYCQETDEVHLACAFHKVMVELLEAQVGVLTRWTVADLAAKPNPSRGLEGGAQCTMGVEFAKHVR